MIAAGEFTAPTSAGNFSYTDLDFQPTQLLFFGSNQSTDDTIITGAGFGLFMGLAGLDYADGVTLKQHTNTWIVGRASFHTNSAIALLGTTGGTLQMRADIVSLDGGGFTLNFTTAPPAGRKIKFLAVGGETQTGFFSTWSNAGDVDITPGYRVKTTMGLSHRDGVGDGDTLNTATHWTSWGMFSYPPSALNYGMDFIQANYNSGHQINTFYYNTLSTPFVGIGAPGAIGTILSGQLDIYPTGTGGLTFRHNWQTSDNWWSEIFWGDPSSAGVVTPSATVDVSVDSTLANGTEMTIADAVFYYTCADEYGALGGAFDAESIVGFGVATKDYQGCVHIEGDSASMYQSSNKSWISRVNATQVLAGVTDFDNAPVGKLRLKTTESIGAPSAPNVVYLAMVSEEPFIPGFYRIR